MTGSKNIGNVLIYQTEKGDTKIDVYFENNDVWMNQKGLAELYQVQIPTINEHIKNILSDGELDESTIREFLIVQNEASRKVERQVKHYNFQMILAIGFRVRSNVGLHFRNWASQVLTEYSRKGFVLNDERLKNPQLFGEDYFDELLDRIRDIRASEKRFYLKVLDIYKTSIDYDSKSEQAKTFFQTVQNKMHYSIHGHPAAELIVERADATKLNMGLTSFKGAVVRKGDVETAKNYLSQDEITNLNRLVTMYLDYAEDQASRQIPMHMSDWEGKLDGFLEFTGRKVLKNPGKVSAEKAKEIAEREYQKFSQQQFSKDIDSDRIDDLNESIQQIGKEKGNL